MLIIIVFISRQTLSCALFVNGYKLILPWQEYFLGKYFLLVETALDAV